MTGLFRLAAVVFAVAAVVALGVAARSFQVVPDLVRWLSAGVGAAFIAVLWEVQARLAADPAGGVLVATLGQHARTTVWVLMVVIVVTVAAVWIFYR